MAKLSKDELLKKVDSKETLTDDDKIELMEDISDSFIESEGDSEYKTKYEEEVKKHEETKKKYKERFLEKKELKKDDDEEFIEEKKEIDVKEI